MAKGLSWRSLFSKAIKRYADEEDENESQREERGLVLLATLVPPVLFVASLSMVGVLQNGTVVVVS